MPVRSRRRKVERFKRPLSVIGWEGCKRDETESEYLPEFGILLSQRMEVVTYLTGYVASFLMNRGFLFRYGMILWEVVHQRCFFC